MPDLGLEITQLTVAQAELLLTVPMKCLRPCPVMSADPHDPAAFQDDPIRQQDLAGGIVIPVPLDDHYPDLVIHLGNPLRQGEIPLAPIADPHLFAVAGGDRRGQFVGLEDLPFPLQLPITLQVADITLRSPRRIRPGVDVVEDLGASEVRIHREVPGDRPLANPIDQIVAQHRVAAE